MPEVFFLEEERSDRASKAGQVSQPVQACKLGLGDLSKLTTPAYYFGVKLMFVSVMNFGQINFFVASSGLYSFNTHYYVCSLIQPASLFYTHYKILNAFKFSKNPTNANLTYVWGREEGASALHSPGLGSTLLP